jgi:hypothetical protein
MSFQCRLSAGNEIEKDRCEFEAPNGQTFFSNPGNGMVDVFKLIYEQYVSTAYCDHFGQDHIL